MNETYDKVLKFVIGEESFPVIIKADEQEEGPFGVTIQKAITFIHELVSLNIDEKRDDDNWQYKTRNNIVAFLGERGSGKTSCMRTTIERMKAMNRDAKTDRCLYLDEIDPSFFDEKHNILEVFIGSLYRHFETLKNNWDKLPRERQNSLRNIQDNFRNVKAALRYVEEKYRNDDDYEIDELKHLDEGGNLRSLLKGLIASVLTYESKDVLIVSIDDLDLNISQSYKMLEYIRKHLILPNVVILIAAKYRQLFDSICLDLTNHYKGIEYRVSHKDIAEMSERYLNKILPLDQRFNMPTVDSYLDYKLQLFDESGTRINENEDITVQDKVPALIFEKTRYLFYNSFGMPSLIIPRNLRDLRMLVKLLVKMNDFDENHIENQKAFKNYFYEEWLGIIEPEYRRFARQLIEEENLAKINRFVISKLYDYFLKDFISFSDISEEIKENKSKKPDLYTRERELLYHILNPDNSYWNVSIGDVVVIINTVKKIHDSVQTASLLFFIETYYSMKLYETYNLLTDETDESGLITNKEELSTSPVLKTSIRGDIPEYFRFIGGAFFSGSGDSFIPTTRNGELRERTLINATFLFDEIKKLVQEYTSFEINNKGLEIFPEELTARLRLCEFFMLSIRNREDLKDSKFNIRLINEPLYFKTFGKSAKNLIFDALLPFVTTVYPEYSYSRFDDDIFYFANKDKGSLYNEMKKYEPLRFKANTNWELMSKASIRNMEILEDLTEWLYKRRPDLRPARQSLIGVLTEFYYNFFVDRKEDEMPTLGYFVKTYHRYSDGNKILSDKEKPYYIIDYAIYSLLGNVLDKLNEDNVEDDERANARYMKSLFDGIFSQNDIFLQKDSYTSAEISDTLKRYCRASIVDTVLGRNPESNFNSEQLADILVDIRIEYQYDFNGRLPIGLQFYYGKILGVKYKTQLNDLSLTKEGYDSEINDLAEQISQNDDEIKQINKSKVQAKTDLAKIQVEIISIEAKILEEQNNIELLNRQLEDEEFPPADKNRIRKDSEKSQKNLNSLEASYSRANKLRSLYESRLEDSDTSLKDIKQLKRSIAKEIRGKTKYVDSIKKQIEDLTFRMEHPIPLESRE